MFWRVVIMASAKAASSLDDPGNSFISSWYGLTLAQRSMASIPHLLQLL
jgi:hypothetical protein